MDIQWNGSTAFTLTHKKLVIGLNCAPAKATYRLLSSPRIGEKTENTVLDWPGEYEIDDVLVTGIPSSDTNTLFTLTLQGVTLAHLGLLTRKLTDSELSELGNIDVLMLPVGPATLSPKLAKEIIEQIEPTFVLPMQYDMEDETVLTEFLKIMGIAEAAPQASFSIDKRESTQENTQVVLLTAHSL